MKVKCLLIGLVFACPFLYSQNASVSNDGGSGIGEPLAAAEIVEGKTQKTARREKAITRLRWKNAGARQTKKAHVGDDVFLCANVRNIPDGTGAKIRIFEKCADGHDEDIATLDATVSGGKIKCAWKVSLAKDNEAADDDSDDDSEQESADEVYVFPKYAFTVECGGTTSAESPDLKVMAWISTQFLNKAGEPLANMKYVIYLLDGSAISGKTDGDGYVRLRKMKRGKYFISIDG